MTWRFNDVVGNRLSVFPSDKRQLSLLHTLTMPSRIQRAAALFTYRRPLISSDRASGQSQKQQPAGVDMQSDCLQVVSPPCTADIV